MRIARALRRTAKWCGITVLVVLALGLATVQIGQRLFRHRAELLLADVQTLTVGESTWEDFRRIETQWGAFGHHDGACTPKRCDYSIAFGEWPWEHGPWNSSLPDLLDRPFAVLLSAAHDHMPTIEVEIHIADGSVSRLRLTMATYVPKGEGPGWRFDGTMPDGYVPYSSGEYALIAGWRSDRKHDPLRWPRAVVWPEQLPHPLYAVNEPSACTICIAIHTDYDPALPLSELRPLQQMNLDCITRWKPCVQESDIMPAAWSSYLADLRMREAREARLKACRYTIAERYAAAEHVALVRVLPRVSDPAKPDFVEVKMLKALRGPAGVPSGTVLRLGEETQGEGYDVPILAGREYVVLSAETANQEGLDAHPCGILPASAVAAAGLAAH